MNNRLNLFMIIWHLFTQLHYLIWMPCAMSLFIYIIVLIISLFPSLLSYCAFYGFRPLLSLPSIIPLPHGRKVLGLKSSQHTLQQAENLQLPTYIDSWVWHQWNKQHVLHSDWFTSDCTPMMQGSNENIEKNVGITSV